MTLLHADLISTIIIMLYAGNEVVWLVYQSVQAKVANTVDFNCWLA